MEADPVRAATRSSGDQIARRTAQHEAPCRIVRPIRQHAENWEQVRTALDLVDDHEAPQSVEGDARVRQPFELAGSSRSK